MELPVLSCDDCGACCYTVVAPPFLPGEPVPPSLLPLTAGPDHCSWFDPAAKRCLHYADRPKACVDYPPGSPDCRESRRRFG